MHAVKQIRPIIWSMLVCAQDLLFTAVYLRENYMDIINLPSPHQEYYPVI